MAISVSFINMKGGVGKTTLAMQMALAADQAGFRTLAVDLDPQANLSQALVGAEKYLKHLEENKPTIVQIFEGYMPPTKSATSPTPIEPEEVLVKDVRRYSSSSKLHLIPSRLELSQTLRNPAGKERRLAKALAKVADGYDLIIIDCAPTDSVLTDAAYFASRYVLIPIKPEFMATIGLPLLARSLQAFKLENDDTKIDICGIVFVHSSYTPGPETKQSVSEVTEFAKSQGWPILKAHVRYSKSYPRAARQSVPLSWTRNVHRATKSGFEEFRREFFALIGIQKEAA